MIWQVLIVSIVAALPPSSSVVVETAYSTEWGGSDSVAVLRVQGDVTNPLSLSIDELAALLHHEAQSTIHDRTATYRGVVLGELLTRAGAPEGRDLLRTVVFARGADGYEVVFALAELSTDFTDRVVLIADSRDGAALPEEEGPIRLVVPWEKRAARSVRQVTEIEVRILP
ncbi:MAG: molybdopterin-dependent oxidoreductase [Gemmatimonadales bacterium]|jgi:DMSO/TMAO reductase YedYZ molybdopterin-dependent catalytic subunit